LQVLGEGEIQQILEEDGRAGGDLDQRK